nr:hypothetical protein [Tanacetum cinerariifolium]
MEEQQDRVEKMAHQQQQQAAMFQAQFEALRAEFYARDSFKGDQEACFDDQAALVASLPNMKIRKARCQNCYNSVSLRSTKACFDDQAALVAGTSVGLEANKVVDGDDLESSGLVTPTSDSKSPGEAKVLN